MRELVVTVYQCSQNIHHIVYLEANLAGYPEEESADGMVEELWCLWGCGGQLERRPGPFRILLPDNALMDPTPPRA